MPSTRIFFATDVHGSEKCWMKFVNSGPFYKADVVILGGDTTGKGLVPIVEKHDGTFKSSFLEKEWTLKSQEELEEHEKHIRFAGMYPYRTTPSELEELSSSREKQLKLYSKVMIETMKRWVEVADERLKDTGIKCFVAPGNDDPFEIDRVIDSSKCIVNAEGKVINIDDQHEMISSGWTNPTPWNTYRECSEEELAEKIEAMASEVKDLENCIFALHAPPYGSGLDEAPELDDDFKPVLAGRQKIFVGSKAVHNAIEKFQPLLGLHGHIHESRGSGRIGRTLCVNPGSMYTEGFLMGYLITLNEKGIKNYSATSG